MILLDKKCLLSDKILWDKIFLLSDTILSDKIHNLILSVKIYLLSDRILSDKIYILYDMILSVKKYLLSNRILSDKIHLLSGKILTIKIYSYLTGSFRIRKIFYVTRSCQIRLRSTECSIYEVPGLRWRGSRGRGVNREKWSTGTGVKRVRCKGSNISKDKRSRC